ncbi:glycoside hydrolase family 3 N-terminal domain-containing protein [Planktotalea sp.]|uniref:glycoside hydrolase family 3 N-terminal domain-containing protein n=1 Tax=Planktotalea sp. TaxID=2029877 RepID=UPI0025E1F590|nr:glycoside hydrolase family 3 N-terminal domain-containing protein [Planktotalea sp.]
MTYGATILGCLGPTLSQREISFFRDANPFGFIVFDRNLDDGEQILTLCNSLRDAVGRDAPILIDQEGGRVQRLRPPLATQWLPPLDDLLRYGANAPRAMYLRYRIIADELMALGIDANCAPMVDIASENTHEFLKNRCYGSDLATVVKIGQAAAGGLIDGGVLPVLKHIPGHGRAVSDSHLDLPIVDTNGEILRQTDFAAFTALNDTPMGMTAHITYSAFDDRPATLSPKMMGMIRDDIGFNGLIMTDDISMKALTGSLGELSRLSIDAGCDVVLHCNGKMDEMEEVAAASGAMNADAQRRADAALACRRTPDPVDISDLHAQLDALVNGTGNDV